MTIDTDNIKKVSKALWRRLKTETTTITNNINNEISKLKKEGETLMKEELEREIEKETKKLRN